VVQSFDGHEIVRRFGDKRLATVSTGKHLLREGMDALGVAYFTKGRGYLALDIGMQITAHRLPVASILALIPRSADVMAVVSVSSPTDVQLAVAGSSASTPPSGESAEDEVMELSSGVYGVPLRLGKLAASEELQITVENEAGRVSASAVPELAESTSASGVGVNVKREEPQRLLIRKEQADRSHGRSSTLIRRASAWLTHRRGAVRVASEWPTGREHPGNHEDVGATAQKAVGVKDGQAQASSPPRRGAGAEQLDQSRRNGPTLRRRRQHAGRPGGSRPAAQGGGDGGLRGRLPGSDPAHWSARGQCLARRSGARRLGRLRRGALRGRGEGDPGRS